LHDALWLGQSATWHSLLQYLQAAENSHDHQTCSDIKLNMHAMNSKKLA
jgi:hypothetical protein